MVSLAENAVAPAAPGATAWLLVGSVAVVLVAEIVVVLAFIASEDERLVYRPLLIAMAVAAVAVLGVALVPLPAWALALVLNAILLAIWFVAAGRFMRAGAWPPGGAQAD